MPKQNGRPPKEDMNDEQLSAFSLYVNMGARRSLRKLAAELNKHPSTVAQWNRKYNWQDRLAEIENAKKEYVMKELTAQQLRNAEILVEAKYQALLQLVKHIDYATTDVSELVKIIKTIKVELGEATEISKGIGDTDSTNPFEDIARAFIDTANAKQSRKSRGDEE